MGAQTAPAAQIPPRLRNLSQTVNMLRNARNPQALVRQMMGQNPSMRQAMQYIQQNGGDPKAAAEKLAKERGIDLNAVMNHFR